MHVNDDDMRRILEKARELVRRGWCQDASARNSAGRPVYSGHFGAVRFCMTGAVEKSSDFAPLSSPRTIAAKEYGDAINMLRMFIPGSQFCLSLVTWNDCPERTQAEVLAVFDEAVTSLVDVPDEVPGEWAADEVEAVAR